MRRNYFSFIAIVILFALAGNVSAQPARIFGAHQLQLDDGNGNTITLQTPNGGWIGNIDYLLPQPPYPGGPSGWIAPGTLDGQIPVWSMALNSWQPQSPAIAAGYALNTEPFLTFGPSVSLTNNRILNSGLGISLIASGAFPNASYTVSNTGVLSNVAGAGISVNTATGDVTIDNTGVLSNVAGAGISVSAPNGNVTIDNTGVLSTIAGQGITVSGPNGNVTIDNTGVIQLTGTQNQVLVNGLGSIGQNGMILLSTPQDIAPSSSPVFAGMTLTGLSPAGVVHNNAGGLLSSSAVDLTGADVTGTLPAANGGTGISATATNGQLLIGNGAGYTLSTITGTLDEINVANGAGSITISTPQPIATTSAPTFSALTLSGKGTSASTVAGDVGTTLVTKDFVTTPGNIAVVTDGVTITGNGTAGNAITLNTANANTWTATQSLPATIGQGNNLIASTNAGTTTVNAVRIGNGLTDAQVMDNLTISGGSVTNSPIENSTIGAVTPNTGSFTTIGGTSLALTAKGTSASTVAADPNTTLVTKDFVTTPGNVPVITDGTTITGNGTVGNAITLNTANANTWTATQTLPATIGQGNTLISSVNAGTTTVNASRIGNGLTDAQVNDNLTINGGTIDNSPINSSSIGATTAGTGRFTTITGTSLPAVSASTNIVTSNAGALETRTAASLAGLVPVATDVTLVGNGTIVTPLGVNTANANTWTATQTLPATDAQGSNLISSVNSSAAGLVNATRIGNGLTDAQVNDNLTINAGTVTNSPIENSTIGAVTPNTGAFTTLDANGAVTFSTLPNASLATDIVMSNTGTLQTRTIASLGGNIAVVTDGTTITGNGTVGNPITLNTANSNTWTADQLLPNSSTQGDNLIAAVNASATTINAVNIGVGLTDAQVNNDLTINGGSVTNSPIENSTIGAVTPNTGAFTSITGSDLALTNKATSASTLSTDAPGTLVTLDYVSTPGNVPVVVNPALTGNGMTLSPLDFNLNHTNTWAADQNLPASSTQSDNLITSINSGLSTINAVNIGAGLTDAQVNDNLTINGGSVTNSPIENSTIGAVTPNTGSFTALDANGAVTFSTLPNGSIATDIVMSNVGGLETRTIASLGGLIGVNTDATLIGNGTVVTPLGVDVTHSNTWTADQLLPNSATQGDNLIAATNAGTTTVNAVRIGNGLTDVQVNDNLTINGGTIDNSPIGAVTPNTGAFTTINGTSLALTAKGTSASTTGADAGTTLLTKDFVTTAGNVAVLTNPSLVGDGTTATPLAINLNNSNTYTADQLLPNSATQGDNLIAAVNAGAASSVNATQIGNGLTDAQVNDNLTINGGTINASPITGSSIDNSPIGSATPNTGAFTTLNANNAVTFTALPPASAAMDIVMSNVGGLETRTIASLGGLIGITTDATLTGNGTVVTPLGVDVTHSNTWTADQLLPNSATQGDNLIAATNAGTTTVNAVRIGVGLTDAQVNDNLTINGGTIDNSPIGAVTPNTGAFTTINGASLALTAKGTSASTTGADAGTTLLTKDFVTTAGNVAVLTNPSLVGDGTTATPLAINLNNSNIFIADQMLPATDVQGSNLITSVNSSTAGLVNATRIGAGLTDAQVNDNLTINGGTIDATPINSSSIGATTASTGAFTTLDANGAVTFSTLPNGSLANDIVMSNVGGVLETRTIASLGGNIAVNTDATLTGNGTVISPLGIALNNQNTYTADQLLQNSAAQGDNLIAAVNVGTTNINDANVADNLTINGGTINASPITGSSIDNSPIGVTTASTGAFTTLNATNGTFSALSNGSLATDIVMSNGGSLETRTIASLGGNIAVVTDGTSITGNGTVGNAITLNTGNSNTWTADQLLPNSAAQGDNLIAAVNVGTTNINDANVADNLTINGGTINASPITGSSIDNSPIGVTTQSTGAFTSITGSDLALTNKATSASTLFTDAPGTLVTLDYVSTPGNAPVLVNPALQGNGTTGNELDLNVNHTNTWTADQILPTSSTQGDNLIAAINNSASTINTVNIAAGLTDAQVMDNLTINTGSIDNSPIGAGTASTGAFTTLDANSTVTFSTLPAASAATEIVVSNLGVLETRSIASLNNVVTVTTDATLIGDGTAGNALGLKLNNPNTWTATQTLPVTAAQGDNLIASVNASANTINAVNIGTGLSDAQVNDVLTINGGSVTSSPIENSTIGAVTANTGRFTTITGTALPAVSASTEFVVSNAGAMETRSLASFSSLLWQVGGNALAAPASIGSTNAFDVNFVRNGTTFMSMTSPAAVNEVLFSVPTVTNAAANIVGLGGANDVTMLTVKGDNIPTSVVDHFVVEGNARVTQTLNVTRLVTASIDNTPIGGGIPNTGAFTTLTSNGGITISNNKELTLSGAVNNKYVTNALAAAYTLGPQDHVLVCTNAAVGNVNLPANPPSGRTYVIKSMAAGNINVVPANVAVLIDGVVGNYVVAGGAKNFVTLISDGTDWYVIGK